jgi:dihydroflavonol-4-reductase
MKKVLVTGANGHLGYNLARLLCEKGYSVRASVRNAKDADKMKPLIELGADIVEADIMKPATLPSIMEGIDGLFQVAAVYKLWARDPEKEIVEPSVTGGLNVLRAAKDAGVKKVIFTSSTAAIGNDAPGDRPLNEQDWNDDTRLPYVYAKTTAERKAWEFAKGNELDMIAINPAAIIGPGFYRHTPSTMIFEMILRGKLPAIPPYSFTYVDVRDVAALHLLAYENEDAHGRYIAADKYLTMAELVEQIKTLEPSLKVPTLKLSPFFLRIMSAFDWIANLLTGRGRQVTRESIDEFANRRSWVSGERARKELGWRPMDFTESLKDTLSWITQTFILKDK